MKQLLILALLPLHGFAQSITYTWPGLDANPNSYPIYTNKLFMGRIAQWTGVEACVYNGSDGREFSSYDWPAIPGAAHVRLSCLAFTALRLDSIIITHRSGPGGPDKLRVTIADGAFRRTVMNLEGPSADYEARSIPLSLAMAPAMGSEYEPITILIEPYGGDGGCWELRSVRVVASEQNTFVEGGNAPNDGRLVNAGKP